MSHARQEHGRHRARRLRRWTLPVRPGDSLRTEAEILTVRHSRSRPEYGVVRSRTTVFNQRNELVMRSIVTFLAPLRHPVKV